MKFQDFASFQGSLEKSLPKVILIIVSQDYERSKIFEHIYTIAQKKGRFQRVKFSFEEMDSAIESLSSGSLFAEAPFVIVDGVQAWKKNQEEPLLRYLKDPNQSACLLLGSSEKKGLSFYGEIEAKGTIFDLGFERVKDRERRLLEQLLSRCRACQKTMPMEVIELFFAKTGLDLAIIENELEKLFCFVGEKEHIERKDVLQITSSSDMRNLWEMAEEFVWKHKSLPSSLESSLFYPLVSAIRYQLEQGIRLSCHEEKREESVFLYKKEEEKRKIALQRGADFFKKSLLLLFEIDLLSKTQVNSFDSLFSYLYSKMFVGLS